MSFSLCIAFTYCTDDLVQGNEEGKFIDRQSRNLRTASFSVRGSLWEGSLCMIHWYFKRKKTISIQRKLLGVHQFDHVVRQSMQRKNRFCLKHFSFQGTTDHKSQTVCDRLPTEHYSSFDGHGYWIPVSMQLLLQELVVVVAASLLKKMLMIRMIRIRIRDDSFEFSAQFMWCTVLRMTVLLFILMKAKSIRWGSNKNGWIMFMSRWCTIEW